MEVRSCDCGDLRPTPTVIKHGFKLYYFIFMLNTHTQKKTQYQSTFPFPKSALTLKNLLSGIDTSRPLEVVVALRSALIELTRVNLKETGQEEPEGHRVYSVVISDPFVLQQGSEAQVAAALSWPALISVMRIVQSTRGFVRRLAAEVLRSGGISAPTVGNGFGGRSL